MANYADVETEKRLADLEKRISREYGKAYAEMKVTADAYFDELKERYEREYKAYQQGKYTKEQFIAWYQTQVQRGEGYRKMASDLADRMVSANQVASAYINDDTPTIFSLNANYTAYQISQAYEGISFQLYDEQTVRRLMEGENQTEFKTVRINPKRDYEWNTKQIQSALTSAILQGKDIYELADSFLVVMQRNRTSAIRNARTSYTSAQNSGRLDTAKRAQKMGVKVKKKWLATLDARTRDSHAYLSGQIREIDQPFDNGLMYPADPSGAPKEVYNCRCTMTYVLPDYEEEHSNESYLKWINGQLE